MNLKEKYATIVSYGTPCTSLIQYNKHSFNEYYSKYIIQLRVCFKFLDKLLQLGKLWCMLS